MRNSESDLNPTTTIGRAINYWKASRGHAPSTTEHHYVDGASGRIIATVVSRDLDGLAEVGGSRYIDVAFAKRAVEKSVLFR